MDWKLNEQKLDEMNRDLRELRREFQDIQSIVTAYLEPEDDIQMVEHINMKHTRAWRGPFSH